MNLKHRARDSNQRRFAPFLGAWHGGACALALCATLCAGSARPVLAQPEAGWGETAVGSAALMREWQAVRDQVGEAEVTAPAQAIATYQKFYRERAGQSTQVAVTVASMIAGLYWRGLGQREEAARVYQEALQEYGEHPASEPLRQELALLNNRANAATQGVEKLEWNTIIPHKAPPTAGATLPLPTVPVIAKVTGVGGAQIVARATLLARLSESEGSWERDVAAWQHSGLSAPQLLEILEQPASFEPRTAAAIPRVMALVAHYGAELLQQPQELPEAVQLWLAEYYTGIKDARAEAIYQPLLADLKAQGPPKAREVPALRGLYEFYLATGQQEKAADTIVSAPDYTTKAMILGNAQIGAARLYQSVGQSEKADRAYEQAKKSGYGWGVGMASYDQASALIKQGQYEAARKLLNTPVTGQYADQIKVGMLSLLAYSYYRSGEWEDAREYSKQAIAYAKSLETLLANEGQEKQIARAHEILHWTRLFQTEPIICEPRALPHVGTISAENAKKMDLPVLMKLSVRTFRSIPLVATTDKAGVKVRVKEEEWGGDNEVYFQKQIVIELTPEMLSQDFDLVLTVSSPNFPGFQAQVPIHVEVPKL